MYLTDLVHFTYELRQQLNTNHDMVRHHALQSTENDVMCHHALQLTMTRHVIML